jgi:RNA polymerase sigma-70 factor (ECF subfamily)
MSPENYNQYVEDYTDNIYRYILKNTRNQADAEDIVQVTFQRLWEKRETIDEEKVKSWLFTTAHNRMIDLFRKRKPETPIMPLHQPSSDSDERSLDLKDMINKALRYLPDIQRQVVLLRDYEGYSYADVAEITGLSDSQVKVYIFRARKKLQEVILSMDGGKALAQMQ